MADFLMVPDLGPDGVASVLATAAAVKADRTLHSQAMAGQRVGLFFEKPSTRTRVSCEVGVVDLGAHPVVLKADEVGLGKREAVEDVARTLDRYLDVLAFRVFDHANLVTVADHAEAPVINLLSDRSHPCQALADLQTLAEHTSLHGATVAYIGDGNNVCHSLMLGAGLTGVHLRIAAPSGYEPHPDVVSDAERLALEHGGSIVVTNDARMAVEGVDAVYTDVWASMGQETESGVRRATFADYQVDESLFAMAAPDAIFMHCLPAHRDEEVTHGVMEHERSRVFDQAENRMHAFKALLLHLAGTA